MDEKGLMTPLSAGFGLRIGTASRPYGATSMLDHRNGLAQEKRPRDR
jgi:hypothetical protein